MFSKIVDQKAIKLKFNVDSYLANDKKKQQSHTSNSQALRRDPLSINPAINTSVSQIAPQQKPPDPQVKLMTFNGKSIEPANFTIKLSKKQKDIHIGYAEDNTKFKLELKGTPQNSLQVRKDVEKGILQLQFKRGQRKKCFKEEGNQQIKWLLVNQIKDDKIILTLNNKQYLKNIYKILFEGIIPEDQIKNIQQNKQIVAIGLEEKHIAPLIAEEEQGNNDIIKFAMPTDQQLNQTQKFRKSIKEMKEDQKLYIITDIFKIKKEYEDLDKKKFKCPIYGCQKNEKHYKEVTQLKTHIKKNHPELNKHGIQVTQFGTFEYSQKALDLALYLGKIFPGQMKKIIKKMKTKQAAE